jgi:hypothetical protein
MYYLFLFYCNISCTNAPRCYTCITPLVNRVFVFEGLTQDNYVTSTMCVFVRKPLCLFWRNIPQWPRASSFTRFLDHTQRRTTVRRTPLDGWPVRRRDLYLTTHNTHNRQTSMPPVGLEPTTSAGERPKTYALDRATTNIGHKLLGTWK